MDLLMFFLGTVGIGLIGAMAAVARNPWVNKAASLIHIGGIVFTVIFGWMQFRIIDMLSGVFTIFLVGMIVSYIILKLRKER
jgi:hypothetical protein